MRNIFAKNLPKTIPNAAKGKMERLFENTLIEPILV
jgi:hypothetical protein